jgi:hypothetical protein
VPPGAADADGIVDGAVAGLPQHGVALVGHEHMSEGLPAEVVAHMGYQLDQLPALTAEQMQQVGGVGGGGVTRGGITALLCQAPDCFPG